MDTILLRTLSFKSTLLFGKYSNLTVQNLIDSQKSWYLVWVYYNLSNISFSPKVLKAIGITNIINKPGTDKDLWIKIYPFKKYTTRQGYQYLKFNRKTSKDHIRMQCSTEQNKSKLAWYNQGHR